MRRILSSIDIGTNSIKLVVAEIVRDKVNVLCAVSEESRGIKKGLVENFEDAIRNVISIGGDCDTTGAITGSIAWIYYAGYSNWVMNRLDAPMQKIKTQAMEYLPKEFVDVAEEFIQVCGRRAGTYHRLGGCSRTVIHGCVSAVHTGQLRNHRLILKDIA